MSLELSRSIADLSKVLLCDLGLIPEELVRDQAVSQNIVHAQELLHKKLLCSGLLLGFARRCEHVRHLRSTSRRDLLPGAEVPLACCVGSLTSLAVVNSAMAGS